MSEPDPDEMTTEETQEGKRMRKIIGLVGYAGSGKDSAAEALTRQGWERVAFADPVREMALAVDPFIPAYVGQSARLSAIVAKHGWPWAKKNPEVRRLLQAMGTEAGRNVLGESVWVDLARKKICATTKDVVITDVRFPNEAALVRELGGKLVRIQRANALPVNRHISEQILDEIEHDAEIFNDGTLEELHGAIVEAASLTPYIETGVKSY